MLWETSFTEEIDSMPQTVPRSGRSPPQAPQGERAVPASPGSPNTLHHLLRLLDASSPTHSMQTQFCADYMTKPPPPYVEPQQLTDFESDENILDKFYEFQYGSPTFPTPSPSSDGGSVTAAELRATSPFLSGNATYMTEVIKKENKFLTPEYSSPYPLSPCPSYTSGVQSPGDFNKSFEEEYVDIETLLGQNQILSGGFLSPKREVEDRPRDHLLLRSVLEDTTFQKKFNLKPIELELESVKMEEDATDIASNNIDEVLSLAIEHTKKDVHDTCAMLGISPDPMQWTEGDVGSWATFTARQFSLTSISLDYFSMNGPALMSLTEEEFEMRAPEAGSTLYAQLEIWKAARPESYRQPNAWSNNTASNSTADNQMTPLKNKQEETSDDEDTSTAATTAPAVVASGKPATKTGSHIHLWQFLKELLATPQLHGSAIRWLDRSSGVFKIEDSVRVAKLWGKRKNRPAMNYDKLSRSIRQYYKKGIMKKTERSQRLVYQFCHPYSL